MCNKRAFQEEWDRKLAKSVSESKKNQIEVLESLQLEIVQFNYTLSEVKNAISKKLKYLKSDNKR